MNMVTTHSMGDAKRCIQRVSETANAALDAVQSQNASSAVSNVGAIGANVDVVWRNGIAYERLNVPQAFIDKLNKLDGFGDRLKPTLTRCAGDISNHRFEVAKALKSFDDMLTFTLTKDQAMGRDFRDTQHALTDVTNEPITKYVTKCVADLVRNAGSLLLPQNGTQIASSNATQATTSTITATTTATPAATQIATQVTTSNATVAMNETSAKVLRVFVTAIDNVCECVTDVSDFVTRAVISAAESLRTTVSYKGTLGARRDIPKFYDNLKSIANEAMANVPACISKHVKKATDDFADLQKTLQSNATIAAVAVAKPAAGAQPSLPARPAASTPVGTAATIPATTPTTTSTSTSPTTAAATPTAAPAAAAEAVPATVVETKKDAAAPAAPKA